MQKKEQLLAVGRELYQKGLLVGTDGNLSVRLPNGEIWITASGVCKGKLEQEDLVLVSLQGEVLEGKPPARDLRMHLAVYQTNPEAVAVVHAHPPYATALSMCRPKQTPMALPEALFNLQGVAHTAYCTPISFEVPLEVTRVLTEQPQAQAILLANHGALTIGSSPWDAFYKMETLEFFCQTTYLAETFGGVRYLTTEQAEDVARIVAGENADDVAAERRKSI